MRFPTAFPIVLATIAAQAAAADDGVRKRECSFERSGRPIVQGSCIVKTATLNGIIDMTIRMDDGKAFHLEGPLAGEADRYRLQGGMAHLKGDDHVDPRCYVRNDQGMTLCLGRTLD